MFIGNAHSESGVKWTNMAVVNKGENYNIERMQKIIYTQMHATIKKLIYETNLRNQQTRTHIQQSQIVANQGGKRKKAQD